MIKKMGLDLRKRVIIRKKKRKEKKVNTGTDDKLKVKPTQSRSRMKVSQAFKESQCTPRVWTAGGKHF